MIRLLHESNSITGSEFDHFTISKHSIPVSMLGYVQHNLPPIRNTNTEICFANKLCRLCQLTTTNAAPCLKSLSLARNISGLALLKSFCCANQYMG